ncbi:hypothetical protein DFH06DRAFT_1134147 [Mycena polygramma]|nr:hypothetical protein DFH06DRAFT_1134147 [Mycena polygramma]
MKLLESMLRPLKPLGAIASHKSKRFPPQPVLPPELWEIVLDELSESELLRMATVCTAFTALCIHIIVRRRMPDTHNSDETLFSSPYLELLSPMLAVIHLSFKARHECGSPAGHPEFTRGNTRGKLDPWVRVPVATGFHGSEFGFGYNKFLLRIFKQKQKNTCESIRGKPVTRGSSTRDGGFPTDPSTASNIAGTRATADISHLGCIWRHPGYIYVWITSDQRSIMICDQFIYRFIQEPAGNLESIPGRSDRLIRLRLIALVLLQRFTQDVNYNLLDECGKLPFSRPFASTHSDTLIYYSAKTTEVFPLALNVFRRRKSNHLPFMACGVLTASLLSSILSKPSNFFNNKSDRYKTLKESVETVCFYCKQFGQNLGDATKNPVSMEMQPTQVLACYFAPVNIRRDLRLLGDFIICCDFTARTLRRDFHAKNSHLSYGTKYIEKWAGRGALRTICSTISTMAGRIAGPVIIFTADTFAADICSCWPTDIAEWGLHMAKFEHPKSHKLGSRARHMFRLKEKAIPESRFDRSAHIRMHTGEMRQVEAPSILLSVHLWSIPSNSLSKPFTILVFNNRLITRLILSQESVPSRPGIPATRLPQPGGRAGRTAGIDSIDPTALGLFLHQHPTIEDLEYDGRSNELLPRPVVDPPLIHPGLATLDLRRDGERCTGRLIPALIHSPNFHTFGFSIGHGFFSPLNLLGFASDLRNISSRQNDIRLKFSFIIYAPFPTEELSDVARTLHCIRWVDIMYSELTQVRTILPWLALLPAVAHIHFRITFGMRSGKRVPDEVAMALARTILGPGPELSVERCFASCLGIEVYSQIILGACGCGAWPARSIFSSEPTDASGMIILTFQLLSRIPPQSTLCISSQQRPLLTWHSSMTLFRLHDNELNSMTAVTLGCALANDQRCGLRPPTASSTEDYLKSEEPNVDGSGSRWLAAGDLRQSKIRPSTSLVSPTGYSIAGIQPVSLFHQGALGAIGGANEKTLPLFKPGREQRCWYLTRRGLGQEPNKYAAIQACTIRRKRYSTSTRWALMDKSLGAIMYGVAGIRPVPLFKPAGYDIADTRPVPSAGC